MRDSGIFIFGALGATSLLQTFSKTAAGRTRPQTGLGHDHFEPFKGTPDYHSLPSGHTMASMTITSVLAHQVKKPALENRTLFCGYRYGIGPGLQSGPLGI